MNKEQQRIAIAEACGMDISRTPNPEPADRWKTCYFTPKAAKKRRASWPSSAVVKVIPDYCNDLNAMHKAEELCGEVYSIKSCVYDDWLSCVIGHDQKWRATAAQRAEAFLKTLGLWEEES